MFSLISDIVGLPKEEEVLKTQKTDKNQNIKLFLGTFSKSTNISFSEANKVFEEKQKEQNKQKNKEEKEKREKEREEGSFEKLKEEYKQSKLEIVSQLQTKQGLPTKECRKAILLCLLEDYNQMEKKLCCTSNERLVIRLKEFGFDINLSTLKRDLKELEEEEVINRKIQRYHNENHQVKTARSIRTEESNQAHQVNTFCPIDTVLESISNKFKDIYIEISREFLRLKKSLQEGYKRIKKYYERRKAEKQQSGKPLNVHEVVEYFIQELRKPASKAIDFFNWYSKRGWLDSGGKAISSWRGIATVWG